MGTAPASGPLHHDLWTPADLGLVSTPGLVRPEPRTGSRPGVPTRSLRGAVTQSHPSSLPTALVAAFVVICVRRVVAPYQCFLGGAVMLPASCRYTASKAFSVAPYQSVFCVARLRCWRG